MVNEAQSLSKPRIMRASFSERCVASGEDRRREPASREKLRLGESQGVESLV